MEANLTEEIAENLAEGVTEAAEEDSGKFKWYAVRIFRS